MPSVLRVLHFFYSIEEIFVNGDTCRRSILTPPSNALSHPNSHFLRLVSNMCVCFFFPLLSRYKYLYIYIHIYICSFFFCYSNSSKREKKVHTTDVRVVFEAVRKSMLKQLKKKKRLAVTLLFLYTRTQLSVLNVVYAMLLTVLFPRLSAPQTERSSSVSKDAPC